MNDASFSMVRLHDTDVTLADPADDLRGRKVADRDGLEVGVVEDLIIDAAERRARFLEIDAADDSGLSLLKQLVPVDTITRIDDGVVHISPDRMMVAGGPGYDPAAVLERPYYAAVYGYYDCPPFWWPTHDPEPGAIANQYDAER